MPNKFGPFMPINETATGGVFLPGLAGDPHPQAGLFPIGTYFIPASGDGQGTLYPLAEPLPAQPLALPAEVASVARAAGGADYLVPDVPLPSPVPQEIVQLPDMSYPSPLGAQALGQPLPTTVAPFQQPWPPLAEQPAQVLLPPPSAEPFPVVQNAQPDAAALPEVLVPPAADGPSMVAPPLVAPGLLPLPDVPLGPPLPAPAAAEPLAFQQTPGIAALLDVLKDVAEARRRLQDAQEERSRLRAPVPEPNLGRVVWEQSWGGDK